MRAILIKLREPKLMLAIGFCLCLGSCGGGKSDTDSETQLSPINDTGVDRCVDSEWQIITCGTQTTQRELYGQDANYGRDFLARTGQLDKIGSGKSGFDFSKIDASGLTLADQNLAWQENGSEQSSTQWSCVNDNVTGLLWESKSNKAEELRYRDMTVTWYNPNANVNGGNSGAQGTDCGSLAVCNTQAYIEKLNEIALCGRTNWRLPTVNELLSIADQSMTNPPLDSHFFPNAAYNAHWTSQSVASDPSLAWYVYFTAAGNGSINKNGQAHIQPVSSME